MRVDIITLFPEFIEAGISYSIVKRAREIGALTVGTRNPRDFSHDRHRTVDDSPYGGGAGMVMKPDVVCAAAEACLAEANVEKPRIVLLEPQARLFDQQLAAQWATEPYLMLISGHYEGIDERIRQGLVTDVVSIGDYVLTGGELPALVIIDAIARLLPGVVGSEESLEQDSFAEGLLGYPQYTRPEEFHGMRVPEVLQSGNHAEIARWRRKQSLLRTRQERPDLFARVPIKKEDLKLMDEH